MQIRNKIAMFHKNSTILFRLTHIDIEFAIFNEILYRASYVKTT